jgi:hypothetical protein
LTIFVILSYSPLTSIIKPDSIFDTILPSSSNTGTDKTDFIDARPPSLTYITGFDINEALSLLPFIIPSNCKVNK